MICSQRDSSRTSASLVRICIAVAFLAVFFPVRLGAQATAHPERKSDFVNTPEQIRIHYLAAGSRADAQRPTILFVPGWTMPAWIWDAQIDYFAKDFYVVAMDPRSQADSPVVNEGDSPTGRAADIDAVVQSLHLAPVVLVGWSQGVSDLAAYFKRYGSKDLAGFVLVDGFAGIDMDGDTAKAIFGMIGQITNNREKFTDQFVRSMYKSKQTDEYLARVSKSSLRTPTAIAVAEFTALWATDNRPALKQVDKPTLILTPKGGFSAPMEEAMQASIPNSEIEEMEGVGHALFVDNPDAFNERLARFITTRVINASPHAQSLAGATTGAH